MQEVFGIDIGKFFDWVSGAPPPILATLGTLLCGFMLKRLDVLPNKYIPGILMLAVGPGLLLLARYGLARFYVEGMVYAGIVWLFHAQIWKRVAPLVGIKSEGFETETVEKPKPSDQP